MFSSPRSTLARHPRITHRSRRLLLEALENRQLMATSVFHSIDGTGNNLSNTEWGSTAEQLLRKSAAEYGNGISTPAGADRPSARVISNVLADHVDSATPNDRNLTAYLYVWGQFLDHDLDLTGTNAAEPFNVTVPTGDEVFDPAGTGTQILTLNRSKFDATTGTNAANPRQQVNSVTAWIDGSMIYGSDSATALSLRTLAGGLLRTSAGNLLPVDANGFFQAGDVRANENVEFSSMQSLFVREHNRIATEIGRTTKGLSDEELYQRARAIVIAEVQAVTYNEWLPAMLGSNALKTYRGYNPAVNPGIANEFSTAAFRLHSSINDDVEFFDNQGNPITFSYVNAQGQTIEVDGEVSLAEAFFNPTLLRQSGVDGILKYAASTKAEEIDNQLVDSLRNFLLTDGNSPKLDLAALNIQRGRDHGLADYNAVRAAYGLKKVTTFAQITSDVAVQQKLKDLYGNVDNIDLWAGALAEDHVRGSSVGPLTQRILVDQFERLRDGDRFWYQRAFSGRQLADLERTSLSDVIERYTGVKGLQDNVFFFTAQASGQVFADANGNGALDRRETGLPQVTVQLLDDAGGVLESTITNRDGRFTFTKFPETGDFSVRVVPPTGMVLTTASVRAFHIASGDVGVNNLNFGLKASAKSSAALATTTSTTAAATNAAPQPEPVAVVFNPTAREREWPRRIDALFNGEWDL